MRVGESDPLSVLGEQRLPPVEMGQVLSIAEVSNQVCNVGVEIDRRVWRKQIALFVRLRKARCLDHGKPPLRINNTPHRLTLKIGFFTAPGTWLRAFLRRLSCPPFYLQWQRSGRTPRSRS